MITHDSRDLFYRTPFGAVAHGTTVILRLLFNDEKLPEQCRCNVWREGYENEIDMQYNPNNKSFECTVDAVSDSNPLWYYFIFLYDDGKMLFYGNNDKLLGGIGKLYKKNPVSFQITVYDSLFKTPGWWKEGPVYHIFIDRFNKSDFYAIPRNERDYHYHDNWDEDPLYLPHGNSKKYFPDDIFGGNLMGIIEKLDYISSLGTGTIYLSPVFEAHSNHKYDTADYTKIDKNFGTNEIFVELCKKASHLGMNIILDGVFSHTGNDSLYFNKFGRYDETGAYQSPESPYYEWYTFKKYPDKYNCWWNFTTMPTVNKSNTDYRDFINGKNGVVKKWLEHGASGWRLDVADELPMDFLRELRDSAKAENPDALVIGEVWEDASNKVVQDILRNYCYGDTLDSVMNYPVRNAILNFMTGKITSSDSVSMLESLLENYPSEFHGAAMNLLGSHDRPRMRTVLSGAPDHETLSREEQAKYVPDAAEFALSIDSVKCASALLFTIPGVPYIYYGDETGMTGMTDPFNRGTYPWGNENKNLIDFFRLIGNFRKSNGILINGSTAYHALNEDVIGCLRTWKEACILTIINRNISITYNIEFPMTAINSLQDLSSNKQYFASNGLLSIEIPPLSYLILTSI